MTKHNCELCSFDRLSLPNGETQCELVLNHTEEELLAMLPNEIEKSSTKGYLTVDYDSEYRGGTYHVRYLTKDFDPSKLDGFIRPGVLYDAGKKKTKAEGYAVFIHMFEVHKTYKNN